MKYNYYIYCILVSLATLSSCKKDFLDATPNKNTTIPTTINDFQKLLDNDLQFYGVTPLFGEISSDNYYVDNSSLQTYFALVQNEYKWESNTYLNDGGNGVQDWQLPYAAIFNANVVLDYLPMANTTTSNQDDINAIRGSALFFRAYHTYLLAQVFAPVYNPSTAAKDLGVPLRLSSDLGIQSFRATVEATYAQIIKDITAAIDLLPQTVPIPSLKNRPSKPSALGFLARVYLSMGDYQNAFKYANESVLAYNTITDYNTIPNSASSAILSNPSEVELMSISGALDPIINANPTTLINSDLYQSYHDNDLRKSLFFQANGDGTVYFRGSYSTDAFFMFSGITTSEIYLIRAECNARLGKRQAAMDDLNYLLIRRWKTGSFTPLTAATDDAAIDIILAERRKELLFRGQRWTDLRRLNLDPKRAVTLTRTADNKTYTLPPNDARYTMMIPLDEVQLSGIEQNLR